MSNSLFIISIPLIALIISFVSTRGTLSDLKYKRKWWKVVTIRGWIVIGLTLLITGLLLWQNYIVERRDNIKDLELKKQNEKRDSIISSKVDSNRKILFEDLSEALASQNLKLDTVTKKLEVLKDSSQKKVIIFEGEAPILNFCNDGISLIEEKEDSCTFLIKVCCENSGSRDINLTLITLVSPLEATQSTNNLIVSGKTLFLSKKLSIPKSEGRFQSITITDKNIARYKTFYFFLYGSYSNSTNTKKFLINSIMRFDMSKRISGRLANPYDEKIKAFLKSKNLYQGE